MLDRLFSLDAMVRLHLITISILFSLKDNQDFNLTETVSFIQKIYSYECAARITAHQTDESFEFVK